MCLCEKRVWFLWKEGMVCDIVCGKTMWSVCGKRVWFVCGKMAG